jgi:DNA polymerase-3 subunit epsilon
MIEFKRPICFLDCETTGTNVATDRIVSISVRKYSSMTDFEDRGTLINPGIPIPPKATETHGITDEMVVDKPIFNRIAKSLVDFMSGCNLAGYNIINFDIPLLSEEFSRSGISFPGDGLMLDACSIFKKKEERNLTAALKFFCGKELTDAHDAMADTIASAEVFFQQLNHYPDLGELSIEDLAEYCKWDKRIDLAGNFILNDEGVVVFSFGKYKSEPVVQTMKFKNKGYYDWFMGADFPSQSKTVLRQLMGELL